LRFFGVPVAIDRDIERMARYLIARHGAAAAQVAQDRVRELDIAGDKGAAAVWREIAEAVKTLQK
jgi:phosphohistidine phosphatase SixA